MKKYIIFTLWLFANFSVNSQNIDRVEYFFDNDPGFANATSVVITPATAINSNFTADLSGLGEGFHSLYLRARNSTGKWSQTNRRVIYKFINSTADVLAVDKMEYFIDGDPGFGNATNIPITESAAITASFVVDLNGITDGFHSLFVRSRDENGKWSQTTRRVFYKTAPAPTVENTQVTKVEYFIDDDPGFGNGTAVSIPANQSSLDESIVVDITDVSIGVHRLYIRAKDSRGRWSILAYHEFEKETAPLAVKILTFIGKEEGSFNHLNWTIADQSDIEKFTIQRSVDGKTWTEIGKVEAESNDENYNFNWIDKSPLPSSFYRLKIYEKSEKTNLSPTISIYRQLPNDIIAFPNPFTNHTALKVDADTDSDMVVSVLEISGEVVNVQEIAAKAGQHEYDLGIENLNSGIYLVRIQSNNTTRYLHLIKQ